MKILLRFPHGLGDVVQFSVVLKHLARYRKDWQIDVKVGRGKHTALIGLCNHVWHDQEKMPDEGTYESVADIGWYENYCRFENKPNSKITNCLHEVFGLGYDKDLGTYEMHLSAEARERAAGYLLSIGAKEVNGRFNTVLMHYEGNTSQWKKNLKHWQAESLCRLAIGAGRIPIVFDWDRRSPLPDQRSIFCPKTGEGDIWGGFGSGDAETIGALIHLSEAYIGIDSGPGKCASTTSTPTLICWMDHHPIQFHDPATNTVHLVPTEWRKLGPADHEAVARYFVEHYTFRTYDGGEPGLVLEAEKWLSEVLGCNPVKRDDAEVVPYVMPQGIGDCIWALTKLQSIAAGKPIDIIVPGNHNKEIDIRVLPFLKRFPFIHNARVLDISILQDNEHRNDDKGRYRYVADGRRAGFHFLIPNTVLERGDRLETWLPEYPTDFRIMDEFNWSGTELGDKLAVALHPFAAFYLGPETGHTDEGHNRGWLWEPKHWVELAKMLGAFGLNLCVVGAPYDRSFWERYVKGGFEEMGVKAIDLIGKLEIGETLALLRKSKVFVSYQCGLGIVTHYLGGKVVMWWRPDGDSSHPKRMVAFDERMKDAWVNPELAGNYMGCVYKKETPGDLMAEMDKRGWLA